jgi:hypothetical protein
LHRPNVIPWHTKVDEPPQSGGSRRKGYSYMISSKKSPGKSRKLDKATDAADLVRGSRTHDSKPINKLEVKPQERQHISLGNFTAAKPPIGFSVGVAPDPDPVGSVMSEIESLGTPDSYELILHLVNYSDATVTARVWQL